MLKTETRMRVIYTESDLLAMAIADLKAEGEEPPSDSVGNRAQVTPMWSPPDAKGRRRLLGVEVVFPWKEVQP